MEKICNKCLIVKPLDQFPIQKEGKLGRASYCKACFSARHKERYSKHIPLPLASPGNKICRKCLAEKPLIAFSRASKSLDGRAAQCKDCIRYRQYVLNREASLARMKAAYDRNKEQYRLTQQKNREENGERYNATHRKWAERNPLRVNELSKRHKARKRVATVEEVDYQHILERNDMWCYICEQDILPHHKLQFDHCIPLARNGPHTENNIHPTHEVCNQRKRDKLMEELTPYDRRGPDA